MHVVLYFISPRFGRNQFGQLGIGNTDDCLVPVPLPTFADLDVVDAACGAEHSVAVTSTGDVYAWGWGNYGPLGLGDRSHRTTCQKLQPFHNAAQVSKLGT
jgi:alpha-tubulin suppressor-like RCC1 family protein